MSLMNWLKKRSSDSTDNLDSPFKRRELDVEESPKGQCSTMLSMNVTKKFKKTKVNWLWKIRRQLVSLQIDYNYEVNNQSPLSNLFRKFVLQNIPVQISINLNDDYM